VSERSLFGVFLTPPEIASRPSAETQFNCSHDMELQQQDGVPARKKP